MKSLWWFYLNLPLSKIKPDNWNDITVKTPNIVRSEVCDFINWVDINNNQNHKNDPYRFNNKNVRIDTHGSGRLLQKSLSFDREKSNTTNDGSCELDTIRSNFFKRTASTANITINRSVILPMEKCEN